MFADEVLVIDDYSDDRTVEVINRLKNPKVKVFVHALKNNFSAQRNFALQESQSDWVFFVDIDEIVTQELKQEVKRAIMDEKANGYYVKREDFLWGKKVKYGEVGNMKLLRLGRIGEGKWVGAVHEEWSIKGTVKSLNATLIHKPHESVHEFVREINYYSTIRASELKSKNIRSNLFFIIIYPLTKFIVNYFFQKGYKDGVRGLMLAVLMSMHSFLVRAKLYILQSEHEEN